jgi:hypothetical protein
MEEIVETGQGATTPRKTRDHVYSKEKVTA